MPTCLWAAAEDGLLDTFDRLTCRARWLSPADVKPGGAIDVSDEARFAELMAACPYSPRIFNNLSADRIHFSATGG